MVKKLSGKQLEKMSPSELLLLNKPKKSNSNQNPKLKKYQ